VRAGGSFAPPPPRRLGEGRLRKFRLGLLWGQWGLVGVLPLEWEFEGEVALSDMPPTAELGLGLTVRWQCDDSGIRNGGTGSTSSRGRLHSSIEISVFVCTMKEILMGLGLTVPLQCNCSGGGRLSIFMLRRV